MECNLASVFLWVPGDISSLPSQSISPRSFLCSYSGTMSLSFLPSTQVIPFMPWWRSDLNPCRWLYSSLAFFFILQSLHNYILLSSQRLWFSFMKTSGESKSSSLDHFLSDCFWYLGLWEISHNSQELYILPLTFGMSGENRNIFGPKLVFLLGFWQVHSAIFFFFLNLLLGMRINFFFLLLLSRGAFHKLHIRTHSSYFCGFSYYSRLFSTAYILRKTALLSLMGDIICITKQIWTCIMRHESSKPAGVF